MKIHKPKYSVIVPVYNRPQELRELLESLVHQSFKDFEVIVVEDGSKDCCDIEVEGFSNLLDIKYYKKSNSGPGLTRNYGVDIAIADTFIFFDSDCLIPSGYFLHLDNFLKNNPVDAFGGPDKFHDKFSTIQKAIGYAMSSFLTTGGIRGGKASVEKFHPRSFNMGFTRKVYEATGGFSSIRFGEDMDLSIRIKKMGFSSALIPDAFVYHKRRTDFKKFFKQVYNSGIARINLFKRHPKSLKLFHFFPACFVVYSLIAVFASAIYKNIFPLIPLIIYSVAITIAALIAHKNVTLALLSLAASLVQLFGYGTGFLYAAWNRLILGKEEFEAFKKNFYK